MGSAAPSLRRWLSVALLVAVGLGTAVLWPRPEGSSPSSKDEAPTSETAAQLPPATTVSLELAPGRSVPSVVSDPIDASAEAADTDGGGTDGDDADGHDHFELPRLETGDDTVGTTVDVPEDASVFIVHGASERTVAFRFRTGESWAEWEEVSMGAAEAPDGLEGDEGYGTTALAGAPVPIPLGTTDLDLVVAGGSTASFDVTFLDLSDETRLPPPAGASIAEDRAAGAEVPPIIARSQWASAGWEYENQSCDDGPSISDHVRAVVVHHTVTTNDYSEAAVPDLLRAIHYSHTVINGWCDIGYNFVVDRFGRIWEARTGSLDEAIIGGHARGFNTSTVGVALLGQHHPGARPSVVTVSDPAQDAVQAVAHWKLGIEGVDPAGHVWLRNRSTTEPLRLAGDSWHYLPAVLGHRDLGVTSCPGDHGADLVESLPSRLAVDRDVSLPYTFVGWRAHDHGPAFVALDAFGGIRPAGSASPWNDAPVGLPGGDAAIAVGGSVDGGYMLSASGTVLAYGSAPSPSAVPSVSAPVDLVVAPDARSGWVLDQAGTLRGFGGPGNRGPVDPVSDPVAASLGADGRGYVVSVDGDLHPVGGAPAAALDSPLPGGVRAIDLDVVVDGDDTIGGWVLDSSGRLHGFGGKATTRVIPTEAAVAVAAADAGPGGWVLDRHGQLWPFGGASLVFPVSTNATAANAVDIDQVGNIYGQEFLDEGPAQFVTAVYELFLGRRPSEAELDLQVTKLEQGDDRSDLAAALATSDFWIGSKLDQMYRDVLGRDPDRAGKAYWLAQLDSGLTLADLGTYFYGSQEYANSAGSTEAYVTELYIVLLGRQPDAAGLASWVGQLDSGRAAPPDVANGFYASIESRRDRAGLLHQQILGSEPDSEIRERWAEQLLVSGDIDVAAQMAGSSDFYRLVTDET